MSKRPQYTYLIVLPSYNYIFRTLFAKLLNTHYKKKKEGGGGSGKRIFRTYQITWDCYASNLRSRVTELCSRHPELHLTSEVVLPHEKKPCVVWSALFLPVVAARALDAPNGYP